MHFRNSIPFLAKPESGQEPDQNEPQLRTHTKPETMSKTWDLNQDWNQEQHCPKAFELHLLN